MLATLPADATITSIEAPQPLVLTGRTNPTRYQMFRSGLQDYMDDTWPGGLDGFKRDLVADGPDLSRSGRRSRAAGARRSSPTTSTSAARRGWDWYARASLGEEKIAALRAAAGFDADDPLARPRPPVP